MARLQILELPEGAGDDRPPFAVIIDQVPRDGEIDPAADYSNVAKQLDARAVMIFHDTVDIPANEVPLDDDGNPLFLKLRIEGEFEQFREQVQDEIRKAQAELAQAVGAADPGGPKCRCCGADCSDGRSWDGGDLYACPACSDWRAKLNMHRAALLDALGMDRLRDWDDIRNAAAGGRKQRYRTQPRGVAMAGGWQGSGRKARLPSGWARIRAEILKRDPTCMICRIRPSTHCDHIVAKADRNGPSDLQGVCGPCHDQKSSREGNDAQRANPRPGRKRPSEQHPGIL